MPRDSAAERLRIGPLVPPPRLVQQLLPLDLYLEPEPVVVVVSAEQIRALAAAGLGLRIVLPEGVEPVAIEADEAV